MVPIAGYRPLGQFNTQILITAELVLAREFRAFHFIGNFCSVARSMLNLFKSLPAFSYTFGRRLRSRILFGLKR